ncbi:MAG TPA: hypothetical protein VF458_19040 [Ktedonobacteraceae bacterium]
MSVHLLRVVGIVDYVYQVSFMISSKKLTTSTLDRQGMLSFRRKAEMLRTSSYLKEQSRRQEIFRPALLLKKKILCVNARCLREALQTPGSWRNSG